MFKTVHDLAAIIVFFVAITTLYMVNIPAKRNVLAFLMHSCLAGASCLSTHVTPQLKQIHSRLS